MKRKPTIPATIPTHTVDPATLQPTQADIDRLHAAQRADIDRLHEEKLAHDDLLARCDDVIAACQRAIAALNAPPPARDPTRLLIREMLDAEEDYFGKDACGCRPEPENDGHCCPWCKARAFLATPQ